MQSKSSDEDLVVLLLNKRMKYIWVHPILTKKEEVGEFLLLCSGAQTLPPLLQRTAATAGTKRAD